MLITLYNRLRHDYKVAPLWQRGMLLLLLAIIFFFVVIRPGFGVYLRQVHDLDFLRNQLVRKQQADTLLLADEPTILGNNKHTQETLVPQLWTKSQLRAVLDRVLRKHTALVLQIDFNDQRAIDYGLLVGVPVSLKANVASAQSEALITDLLDIGFGQVVTMEYINSVLTAEVLYLYTKQPNQKPRQGYTKKVNSVYKKVSPHIQGFYSSAGKIRVICENRLYRVGENCGEYLIVSINALQKTVTLKRNNEIITVRK